MTLELTPVRDEDSFDISAVHAWLQTQIIGLDSIPEVGQFRSGASNLTYLLSYPMRELVLRRPPIGTKAASAHDMKREFFIQRKIRPHFPLAPEVFALCEDHLILGSDFYVMERIVGSILRTDDYIEQDQARVIANAVIDGLVDLHRVDPSALAELNKGSGYVKRQVQGWSKRYRAARSGDVPDGESLMAWLDKNQPVDVASSVIHGDWRLDNMVIDLHTSKLVGVLDWELATVGDPLMDLGSSLAYWVNSDDEPTFASLRRQPSHLPGMPTRNEFIERYLAKANWSCDDFTFYEVFGLFRLSVILQQIWARYLAGQTSNPAFAQFGVAVNVMINRGMAII